MSTNTSGFRVAVNRGLGVCWFRPCGCESVLVNKLADRMGVGIGYNCLGIL